jgi:hypothetical protein
VHAIYLLHRGTHGTDSLFTQAFVAYFSSVLLVRRTLNKTINKSKRTISRSSRIVFVRIRVGEVRAGGGRRTAFPTDLGFPVLERE